MTVRPMLIICTLCPAFISLIYFGGDGKSGALEKKAIIKLLVEKDPHFQGNVSLAEIEEWGSRKGEIRPLVWTKSISIDDINQATATIGYLAERADTRRKPAPQSVRVSYPGTENPAGFLLLSLLNQPNDFWREYLVPEDEPKTTIGDTQKPRLVKTRSETFGEWTPRGEPREKFRYRITIRIYRVWGKEDKVWEWPQHQHLPEGRRPSTYGESYISYLYFNKKEELPPVFGDFMKRMDDLYRKYAKKDFFPTGFFTLPPTAGETG